MTSTGYKRHNKCQVPGSKKLEAQEPIIIVKEWAKEGVC